MRGGSFDSPHTSMIRSLTECVRMCPTTGAYTSYIQWYRVSHESPVVTHHPSSTAKGFVVCLPLVEKLRGLPMNAQRRLQPLILLAVFVTLLRGGALPCHSFTYQLPPRALPVVSRSSAPPVENVGIRAGVAQATGCQPPMSQIVLRMQDWEGDDLRWITRLRRRLRRRGAIGGDKVPAQTGLIVSMVLLFFYHVISTIDVLRKKHPEYWPSYAVGMVADSVVGSLSSNGPLLRDFGFSNILSRDQPHRYLTSAFFHGGICHLLANIAVMVRQPSWLETGLGWPLYLTTFLTTTVLGNLGHMISLNDPFDRMVCSGAGSGLCGLYGLMLVCLVKMGNRSVTRKVAPGLLFLILSGTYLDKVSTISNVAGFGAGIILGILFSPSYRKNYSMRRKNSVEYDPVPRDYRQAMGFGVMPTERGMLPLPIFWGALAVLFTISTSKFKSVPALVLKGILYPGTLS